VIAKPHVHNYLGNISSISWVNNNHTFLDNSAVSSTTTSFELVSPSHTMMRGDNYKILKALRLFVLNVSEHENCYETSTDQCLEGRSS